MSNKYDEVIMLGGAVVVAIVVTLFTNPIIGLFSYLLAMALRIGTGLATLNMRKGTKEPK
ncbi:MAG: hypothetical protein OEX00_02810 [Gammaproteobacteria bacterium]|nr:hypothetical protein [Gammaproteobacteria bacterium]MDH5693525.1 hypothetical protein [Gammaproteobacteria bacterium]